VSCTSIAQAIMRQWDSESRADAFAPEAARFAPLVDVTGLVIYVSIDREPEV